MSSSCLLKSLVFSRMTQFPSNLFSLTQPQKVVSEAQGAWKQIHVASHCRHQRKLTMRHWGSNPGDSSGDWWSRARHAEPGEPP